MGIGAAIMKVVVKVRDVVELAKRFEESPAEAMRELVTDAQQGFKAALKCDYRRKWDPLGRS